MIQGKFNIGGEWFTNTQTYDGAILIARLLANSQSPNANSHNGINGIAVGSGGLTPSKSLRKLGNELARASIASWDYIDSEGNVVEYPTNVVDFRVEFDAGAVVGVVNEIAAVFSFDGETPINGSYDPTVDISESDILVSYTRVSPKTIAVDEALPITYRMTIQPSYSE